MTFTNEKVYIITAGDYSDYQILYVCPTREIAEKVLEEWKALDAIWNTDGYIEEWEITTGLKGGGK